MKLSTRSRYGTRLLLDVARHQEDGPVHLTEVAGRQDLPLKYLEQITIPLKRAGLMKSIRGPKGGYVLGRPAEDISLAEVVGLLEDGECLVDCLAQDDSCRHTATCATRLVWQEAGQALFDRLRRITLADLLKRDEALRARKGSDDVQSRGHGTF